MPTVDHRVYRAEPVELAFDFQSRRCMSSLASTGASFSPGFLLVSSKIGLWSCLFTVLSQGPSGKQCLFTEFTGGYTSWQPFPFPTRPCVIPYPVFRPNQPVPGQPVPLLIFTVCFTFPRWGSNQAWKNFLFPCKQLRISLLLIWPNFPPVWLISLILYVYLYFFT